MKLSFKLNLKKLPPKIALRLLPWLTIVALFIMLWFAVSFLKIYFYETLTQAEEISILRTQVSLRSINIKLFEQVISAIETKKQIDPATLTNLSNPFSVRADTPTPTEKPTE